MSAPRVTWAQAAARGALLMALVAGTPALGANPALQLVFVGAADAPVVFVDVTPEADGDRVELLADGGGMSVKRTERVGPRRPDAAVPAAGADIAFDWAGDDLLVTIRGLGPWQAAHADKTALAAGRPPVASETSARPWLPDVRAGLSTRQVVEATLFGTEVALKGRVLVSSPAPRDRTGASISGVLIADTGEVLDVPLDGVTLDAQDGCSGPAPRVQLAPRGNALVRVEIGRWVCLKDDAAVAPAQGVLLSERARVAVRGLVVREGPGRPSL